MRCRLVAALLICLSCLSCAGPAEDPGQDLLAGARRAYLNGEYLQAEENYQRYLESRQTGPGRLEAWNRLVDIARDVREDPAKAAGLAEAALLEFGWDPQTAPGLLAKAAELTAAGKEYDKAATHWREYLEVPGIDPAARVEAWQRLSRLLTLLGRPDEALAALTRCEAEPAPPDRLAACALERAQALARLKRSTEAEGILKRLADDPALEPQTRALAAFALAEQAEAKGDKALAASLYDAVKATYPNPQVVKKRLEYLKK